MLLIFKNLSFLFIGGIVAILIQNLNTLWPPLQLFVFGIISIIAGILAIQFPETRNDKLPESIGIFICQIITRSPKIWPEFV